MDKEQNNMQSITRYFKTMNIIHPIYNPKVKQHETNCS